MEEQTTSQPSPATSAPVAAPEIPASAAVPQPPLALLPETWPGAWGLYKYSKQAVKRNWAVLLVLTLSSYAVSVLCQIFLKKHLGNLISFLIDFPLSIALVTAYLGSVRGQKVSFGQSLKAGFDLMLCLKYLANTLFLGVVMFATLLLFVVPFFIVVPRLLLAPYFLIDKKMGPLKAISASWEATKGHAGKVWGIIGVSVVFALLILALLVGLYFIFMYSAALVLLYEYLGRNQATAAVATPPADPASVQATPPPAPAA